MIFAIVLKVISVITAGFVVDAAAITAKINRFVHIITKMATIQLNDIDDNVWTCE